MHGDDEHVEDIPVLTGAFIGVSVDTKYLESLGNRRRTICLEMPILWILLEILLFYL